MQNPDSSPSVIEVRFGAGLLLEAGRRVSLQSAENMVELKL
jgi:hypothetical protein